MNQWFGLMNRQCLWRASALALLLLCQRPARADEAEVQLFNREIATLRATLAGLTPQQREEEISARIEQLPPRQQLQPIELQPLAFQGQNGIALVQQGVILLTLFPGDLAPDQPSLPLLAAATQQKLQQALSARYQQENPRRLAMGALTSALASAAMVTLLVLLRRTRRTCVAHLERRAASRARLAATFGMLLTNIEQLLLNLIQLLLSLFIVYSWMAFVLLQFPYTQPWGRQLGSSILNLAIDFASAILGALPGLCSAAAIFVLTRLAQRALNFLFSAIEQHKLTLPGLYPETVGATRRLAGVVLWLFALSIAYPYLPGSGSEAFKGISVFLGLMLSLGSAGLVNQAMSGLVLVYSRALRPGDWVQLGDVEGTVSELGPLSTKVVNRLAQEITLPNVVITSGKIINYTRLAEQQGITIATTVTIGYDTPWRQVHAMLELAARRAPLLNHTQAPRVRQLALQDFYISYELAVQLQSGVCKPDALDALHHEILDVFNQFGVQIMSPNFVLQPDTPVRVAPEESAPPPAAPRPPDNHASTGPQ